MFEKLKKKLNLQSEVSKRHFEEAEDKLILESDIEKLDTIATNYKLNDSRSKYYLQSRGNLKK